MKRLHLLLGMGILALHSGAELYGQGESTFPVNGAPDIRTPVYKLEEATLVVKPGTVLKNSTIYIQDGKIIPASAVKGNVVVRNMKGKYIFPAFIESNSDYGLKEKGEERQRSRRSNNPILAPERPGAYGNNDALKSDYRAHQHIAPDAELAAKLRAMGFGAVISHRHDGIARGTSVLVSTGEGKANNLIIKDQAAAHFSFSKGSSQQDYPGSLMGSIALLRQTYSDADWYARGGKKAEYNIMLESLNQTQSLPQVFETDNRHSILRADKVGDEFGVQYIFKTKGDEYQIADEVAKTKGALIVPINFPEPYDVSDPLNALQVTLSQLRHWESAPRNAAILTSKNIPFSFTANGIDSPSDWFENLRLAIRAGLPADSALAALTTRPAAMFGVSDKVGTLENGKIANFIITNGDIFREKATIEEVWVQGASFRTSTKPELPEGSYELTYGKEVFTIELRADGNKYKASIKQGKNDIPVQISAMETAVSLSFRPDSTRSPITLSGAIAPDGWHGVALPGGNIQPWKAVYKGNSKKDDNNKKPEPLQFGALTFPPTEYGTTELPKARKTLFRNATVWTNEADGILQNADVLIDGGKIVAVGKNLSAGGAEVINAEGKHITPGIIDEHSHVAISGGVNEFTRAMTAEVRIGDVINPDDINIYRQLAGGVTMSQLLHGSANPVGGQSAIVKLRWGKSADSMKVENAPGYIKFALGENVKQSNWGDFQTTRFPQTRMGVEQVFRDGFSRARAYDKERRRRPASPPDVPLRRDLTLDALAEILNSQRFITCHSYVQSEITMLMRVAEDFGFTVNTFTHILEGYKVADKMKKHGVGGSSFSDWWAYKYEVIDAIPYNGAILHKMGVVTAFNSDDAEMGRRLNQEAAKAVKYGNVPEEEALKFVTLNPAKLLRLDDRVGSLKSGKDADIVIWSDNPLSIYAKAEMTFVDGIMYYSAKQEEERRMNDAKERERLLQAMMQAKKDGKRTVMPEPQPDEEYNCGSKHVFGYKK